MWRKKTWWADPKNGKGRRRRNNVQRKFIKTNLARDESLSSIPLSWKLAKFAAAWPGYLSGRLWLAACLSPTNTTPHCVTSHCFLALLMACFLCSWTQMRHNKVTTITKCCEVACYRVHSPKTGAIYYNNQLTIIFIWNSFDNINSQHIRWSG